MVYFAFAGQGSRVALLKFDRKGREISIENLNQAPPSLKKSFKSTKTKQNN
jgi:hypothetical protein